MLRSRKFLGEKKMDSQLEILQPSMVDLTYSFKSSSEIPEQYLIKDGVLNTSCKVFTQFTIGHCSGAAQMKAPSSYAKFTFKDNYLEFYLPSITAGIGHWAWLNFNMTNNTKYNYLNIEVTGTGFIYYGGGVKKNCLFGMDELLNGTTTDKSAKSTADHVLPLSGTKLDITNYKDKWICLGMNNQSKGAYTTNIYNLTLSED